MSQAERAHRERRRSDCYRLLSACFYPPERDRWLADEACLELADALHELYPDTGAAVHAAALDAALGEVDALELQIDHAALFVGPFALKAPPYGSIYLEESHTLMGDTTLAAAARYGAAGLNLTLHEPADHIAVELEFMHFLAALASKAVERGDGEEAGRLADEERRFLTEHVGAWAPTFCAAVERGAETRFYRTLADCLHAFLDAEIRHAPPLLASTV
jgi:TorA maturation chaperone TorD